MSQLDLFVENIVLHPMKPEWGPGKVLAVDGKYLTVYFRDIQVGRDGPAMKKFVAASHPLILADVQSDSVLDAVGLDGKKSGRTGTQKSAAAPKRGLLKTAAAAKQVAVAKPAVVSGWTQSRAIEAFMKQFPLGFNDPAQIAERDNKWKAHECYQALLGNGQARKLYDQNDIGTVVERLLQVETETQFLLADEKSALHEGLEDETAAYGFVAALLDFVECPEPESSRFHALVTGVVNLPAGNGGGEAEKWPVVTVFPFLAEPGRFMFFRPDATKLAADRLYLNLEYSHRPNWVTFSHFQEMSLQLLEELRPHGAKDFMDVQTFIDVTGRLEAKKH